MQIGQGQAFGIRHLFCLVALLRLPMGLLACCADSSSTIVTIAGNGMNAHTGDGGSATAANISYPFGLAVDSVGNVYFSEGFYGSVSNTVRKIDTSGIITTVAGNGSIGYAGDGGLATLAKLNLPAGLAIDSSDNLYIADYGNNVIRKVDNAGMITTYCPAAHSTFNSILCLAIDPAGNLLVPDILNHIVRKISSSCTITGVAGTGSQGWSGDGGSALLAKVRFPEAIAIDKFGNSYFSEDINYIIRKVSPSGIISTIAGQVGAGGLTGDGGPASAASIADTHGMASGCAGDLFLSDTDSNNIREINSSNVMLHVAGIGAAGFSGDGGPASSAALNTPRGIAVDTLGNIYIADCANHRIRKIVSGCTFSPTPTSTASVSPTFSFSPTFTPTPSHTTTPTRTPTFTPTKTATISSTTTLSFTLTPTATPSPTVTRTGSLTATWTITLTFTITATLTPTPRPLFLQLHSANPNPSDGTGTYLPFYIATAAKVRVTVYTVSGERVTEIAPSFFSEGEHEQFWDNKNSSQVTVASGVYIFRVEADSPAGEKRSDLGKCAVVK